MSKLYPPPSHAQSKNQRIAYIDALRGFIMLLVVCGHVSMFVIESNGQSYNDIIAEFKMPLFFFVSGFVFFKVNRYWTIGSICDFLRKKVYVLLVFPLLCMLLYVYVNGYPLIESFFSNKKAGYWYTFTLFEFFCLYIIFEFFLQHLKRERVKNLILLGVAFGFYIAAIRYYHYLREGWPAFLGIAQWSYLVFFVIGILVKKYFDNFQKVLDNRYAITTCILLFVSLNFFPFLQEVSSTVYNFILSLSGLILTFALFRKYQSRFTNSSVLGRSMQYIGRRTLDIYLLHYFFVAGISHELFADVAIASSPFIEFLFSVLIALLVVGACLVVSNVLRLSPLFESYFFGLKETSKFDTYN